MQASHQADNELFEIERLIGKRYHRRRIQYLVLWKGYSEEDATWEAASHLKSTVADMIDDFEQSLTVKLEKESTPAVKNHRDKAQQTKATASTAKKSIEPAHSPLSSIEENAEELKKSTQSSQPLGRPQDVSFGRVHSKHETDVPPSHGSLAVNMEFVDLKKTEELAKEKSKSRLIENQGINPSVVLVNNSNSLAEALDEIAPHLQKVSEQPLIPFQPPKPRCHNRKLRANKRGNKKEQKRKKVQEKEGNDSETVQKKEKMQPIQSQASRKIRGCPLAIKGLQEAVSPSEKEKSTVNDHQGTTELDLKPGKRRSFSKEKDDEDDQTRPHEPTTPTVRMLHMLPRCDSGEVFCIVEYTNQSLWKATLLELMSMHPQELHQLLLERLG